MSIQQITLLASCLLLLVACQSAVTSDAATRPPASTPAATSITEAITIESTQTTAEGSIETTPTAESLVQGVVETVAPPTPLATSTATATPPSVGSAERPLQLLFPPIAEGSVISARGTVLAEALSARTGLTFTIGVVDDEATLLQLLCAAPADTIGFLSAAGYVLAAEQCAAQVGPVAQRSDDDLAWGAGMIVTRRDSGIDELDDLAGKRWAVADTADLATFHYFQAEMDAAGIEPGEIMTFPEDSSALLSVLNGDADFATTDYVPPILPGGGPWTYGEDMPEAWRITGISPQRSPIGYILVNGEPANGGYRVRDARARLFDTTPTIFDETEILSLSQPVPNHTLVFGADISAALVRQMKTFLMEFGDSDACATSLCASDFYGWAGLQTADDSDYDPVRFVIDQLALTAADLDLSDEQEE